MADFEENLRSGTACNGSKGLYFGTLHYLSESRRHDIQRTEPVHFGTAREPSGSPALWTTGALEQARSEQGIIIDAERLIAASILRVCWMAHHVNPEENKAIRSRLERVASFAIAKSRDDIEEIKPLNGRERNVSAHGIGHARRVTPGTSEITLVHLPVTQWEADEYPVLRAIRSSVQARSMSRQPYVALHGHGEPLEQIVLLDELRKSSP